MVQRVARNPKPRPRFIEPMERQRVARLLEGDEWLYEPKQVGYRIIAVIDGSTTLLHSMSGLNYTAKYPHIAEALKWLKLREAVFDGEVVALDASGRPNFRELQNARPTSVPLLPRRHADFQNTQRTTQADSDRTDRKRSANRPTIDSKSSTNLRRKKR
jgi:bifunctional non-homologous end joining protein LigD